MNSLTYCREYSWVSLSTNEGPWPLLREDRNTAQSLTRSLGTWSSFCSMRPHSAAWGLGQLLAEIAVPAQRRPAPCCFPAAWASVRKLYLFPIRLKNARFCFHVKPWKREYIYIYFLFKFAGPSSSLFYNKASEWLVREMCAGWAGLCWKSSSLLQCWWVDCSTQAWDKK